MHLIRGEGAHHASGSRPHVAGYINPPIGDVGVPRHGTCGDIGGCTALALCGHRFKLIDVPGAMDETAIVGHYVGEGESSQLVVNTVLMATGAQMATVQTNQVVTVFEDSLALFDLL